MGLCKQAPYLSDICRSNSEIFTIYIQPHCPIAGLLDANAIPNKQPPKIRTEVQPQDRGPVPSHVRTADPPSVSRLYPR